MSDISCQTSDVTRQMSDVSFLMSDVRRLIFVVCCQTCDVRRLMSEASCSSSHARVHLRVWRVLTDGLRKRETGRSLVRIYNNGESNQSIKYFI